MYTHNDFLTSYTQQYIEKFDKVDFIQYLTSDKMKCLPLLILENVLQYRKKEGVYMFWMVFILVMFLTIGCFMYADVNEKKWLWL